MPTRGDFADFGAVREDFHADYTLWRVELVDFFVSLFELDYWN